MKYMYTKIQRSGQNDIYIIRITYDDGMQRTFNVKTNKGSVKISENDTEGKKALVELLIREGLIEKNSLNTEINLGTLIMQNGVLIPRDVQPRGQEQGEVKSRFETWQDQGRVQSRIETWLKQGRVKSHIEIWQEQQESKEPGFQIVNTGKNYACSDIHGKYEAYMNAKRQLKPEDTLWVIGDATDRGMNGIKIIQDIMKSSKKNGSRPQVNYIFGNHDLMLLQCIDAFKKTGMTDREIVEYFENWYITVDYNNAQERWNMSEEEANKIIKKYGSRIQQIRARWKELERKMGDYEKIIKRVCFRNEAWPTISDYYELSRGEQEKIYKFLENSPIMITRQFGDKKVALVHSGPPINVKPKMGVWTTYKDIKSNQNLTEEMKKQIIDSIVWDRASYYENETLPIEDRYNTWSKAGYRIIHGHTPTASNEVESRSDGTISLDISDSWDYSIALYWIEGDEVTYISEGGEIKKAKCNEVAIIKEQKEQEEQEDIYR